MSQENVEVVRGHFENTNARRFGAAMRSYDPSVELVVSEDVAVDPGVYRGVDAVGEWFGKLVSHLRAELPDGPRGADPGQRRHRGGR